MNCRTVWRVKMKMMIKITDTVSDAAAQRQSASAAATTETNARVIGEAEEQASLIEPTSARFVLTHSLALGVEAAPCAVAHFASE